MTEKDHQINTKKGTEDRSATSTTTLTHEQLLCIADFSRYLNSCQSPEEVYTLLGQTLYDLTGDIVMITDYDPSSDTHGMVYQKGINTFLTKVTQLVGYNPLKARFSDADMSEEQAKEFNSGKLTIVPDGLYGFIFYKIPKSVCRSLERLLNINIIYSQGIISEGRRFGGLSILRSEVLSESEQELIMRVSQLANMLLERMLIQKKIQNSEKKYRLLAENSRDVIWTMDLNMRFTYISPSTEFLTGYTATEQMQNSLENFLTPESRLLVEKVFSEELFLESLDYSDPKRTRVLEFQEICKDGRLIWVEGQMSFIRDEHGTVIGILGVSRDITARKKAEEALTHSKNALRAIIDSISDAIFVIDKAFRFTQWNSSFVKWLEQFNTSNQITGKLLIDVCPYITLKSLGDYDLLFEGSGPIITEDNIRVNDRDVIIEMRKIPVYENGEVKSILTIMRDITHSRSLESRISENERQLRSIMDNNPDLIIRLDTELNILYANPAAEKEYSVPSSETHIPNLKFLAMTSPSASELAHTISEVSTKQAPMTKMLVHNIPNAPKYFIGKMIPEFNDKGLLKSIVAILRDITDIKMAEEQVLNMNFQLEEKVRERTVSLETANKELESYSYSVSHDLRTPLRAIEGYNSILHDEYKELLPDNAKELLEKINKNTRKMGNLIDDLLKFSQVTRRELKYQQLDVDNLVRQLWIEKSTSENNRKIRCNIHELPSVKADEKLILQLFDNLITNAIKYTRYEKSPVITISGGVIKDRVYYYIRDNGVGFDMKYAHKLFQVFQRLHDSAEFEGTGVGLAIVRQIVLAHGGEVWAEGETGKGAKIQFSLPLTTTIKHE